MAEEIDQEEIKKKIKEEARETRQKYIQELKQKGENISEAEKSFLEFFEKQENNSLDDEEILRDNYYKIFNEFDYWMDIKDEYKAITALWVIGTYLHDQFPTFPILFINAMRGSGKSRFLNLLSHIAKDGFYIHSNLTEAVAFRIKGSLFIDEFEQIASKEKQTLRELLNSCYKKGSKVYRMKETKSVSGKDYIIQEFDVYRPVCLANITGIDEVLNDRSISVFLEKSRDFSKTSLMENFENNKNLNFIKNQCSLVGFVRVVNIKKVIERWNIYTRECVYNTTLYTNNTNSNNNTKLNTTPYINNINNINYIENNLLDNFNKNKELLENIRLDEFFAKIKNSEITGRHLEIFLPLFLIAMMIGDDVLNYTLKTAKMIISEKKHEEELESPDVILYDFVATQDADLDYQSIKILLNNFRVYSDLNEEWINEKWLGRALKRLGLIIDKRRLNKGVEVIVNAAKAKEKIKMFRSKKPDEK